MAVLLISVLVELVAFVVLVVMVTVVVLVTNEDTVDIKVDAVKVFVINGAVLVTVVI
jgi:hypothetical protein